MCFALSVLVELSQKPTPEQSNSMSEESQRVAAFLRNMVWERFADTLTQLLNMSAARYNLLVSARHDRSPQGPPWDTE